VKYDKSEPVDNRPAFTTDTGAKAMSFEERAQAKAKAEAAKVQGSNVTPRSEIRRLGSGCYQQFLQRMRAWEKKQAKTKKRG
jgi:hypothetical protein